MVPRQERNITSPGLPSGRALSASFISRCPCALAFGARVMGTPHSKKMSAMVLPVSLCRLHMSGGAKVASISSPGRVCSSICLAASPATSPGAAYSL